MAKRKSAAARRVNGKPVTAENLSFSDRVDVPNKRYLTKLGYWLELNPVHSSSIYDLSRKIDYPEPPIKIIEAGDGSIIEVKDTEDPAYLDELSAAMGYEDYLVKRYMWAMGIKTATPDDYVAMLQEIMPDEEWSAMRVKLHWVNSTLADVAESVQLTQLIISMTMGTEEGVQEFIRMFPSQGDGTGQVDGTGERNGAEAEEVSAEDGVSSAVATPEGSTT